MKLFLFFVFLQALSLSESQSYISSPVLPISIISGRNNQLQKPAPAGSRILITFQTLFRETEPHCVRLLVCQVGAQEEPYGNFGRMVGTYFRTEDQSVPALSAMTSVYSLGRTLPHPHACRQRMHTTCLPPDDNLRTLVIRLFH